MDRSLEDPRADFDVVDTRDIDALVSIREEGSYVVLGHVVSRLRAKLASRFSRSQMRRFDVHVFGFRILEDRRAAESPRVLMRAGADVHLAIRQHAGLDRPVSARSWSFVVDDLDRARASIWNLGVPTVRAAK